MAATWGHRVARHNFLQLFEELVLAADWNRRVSTLRPMVDAAAHEEHSELGVLPAQPAVLRLIVRGNGVPDVRLLSLAGEVLEVRRV